MSLFIDAFDWLERKGRIEILQTDRGQYLYDDGDRRYKPLIPEFSRTVSNVDSLAKAVIEESVRRENPTGEFMTVLFTESGGKFYPDDEQRKDTWTFERALSQQWVWLEKHINKPMRHKEFLRVLQALRPSMPTYIELMRDFRKVSFDSKTKVTSQPTIENGQAGATVELTLETSSGSGTAKEALPGIIPIKMPYARAGHQEYEFFLEVDPFLDENGQVTFALIFPDRETVIDDALAGEVAFFKEKVGTEGANLSKLLILLDY